MPKPDELLFALKTFSAAMLAYYISCWLGLDNPYWSMATAFIVSNPFAGAMRSKAVYRFIGTLIGAAGAIAMVPTLAPAPWLLCLAMALWIGFCLYISLLDRSARAYTFMLSGYTAGIIGFPAVSDPGNIFQIALTRCEEITLGIACTTLIGTLIFPRGLGPVLTRRIASWVEPAVEWACAALKGESESAPARNARRRLAFEATDIGMMISQLSYDTSSLQNAAREITRLRLYMVSLMPILASIGPRVAELQRIQGITPVWQTMLTHVENWIRSGQSDDAEPLLHEIHILSQEEAGWAGLVRAGLAMRLEELIRIALHSRLVRQHVLDGKPLPENPTLEAAYIAIQRHNRDYKMAFFSAFSAALAVLLACTVWIESGWVYGAGAAIAVSIACSFFAAQDNPAPAIQKMLLMFLIVIVAIFIYTFGVLPAVSDFNSLYLVLLPAGLMIGILISRPATLGAGMVLGAFGATQLALQNGYTPNFIGFAESSLSLFIGLTCALIITRLTRSIGAAWSAERLMRANWKEVIKAAEIADKHDRAAMTGIMMDRLGLMIPRLAAVEDGADAAAAGALTDLRVGLSVIGLHREQWRLPATACSGCQAVFNGIAAYYRKNPRQPAPPALRLAMDHAMNLLILDANLHRSALMLLSGLRLALYPDAEAPEFNTSVLDQTLS